MKMYYFLIVFYVYIMLRFFAGIATGWVAARSLPPKPPEVSAMSLPSGEELSILGQLIKQLYNDLQEKIKD